MVGRPHFLEAQKLMRHEQWSAAVSAAHATSEVFVRQVFDELMGLAGVQENTFSRQPSMAFYAKNRELLQWYERLSGDRSYRSQPFWTSGRLTEHVKRRHRVVHGGYVCGPAEARDSLAVLDELAAHLDSVVMRLSGHAQPVDPAFAETGRILRRDEEE